MKNKHVHYLKYCICCGDKTIKRRSTSDGFGYDRFSDCKKCGIGVVYCFINTSQYMTFHEKSFYITLHHEQIFTYNFGKRVLYSFDTYGRKTKEQNSSVKEAFDYMKKYFKNLEFV